MSQSTVGTPEILGAILSNNIGNDAQELKADAAGFIEEKTGVNLSECDVSVVENDSSTVHIALPYYDSIEDAAAEVVDDSDMHASGGTGTNNAGFGLAWHVSEIAILALQGSGNDGALRKAYELQDEVIKHQHGVDTSEPAAQEGK